MASLNKVQLIGNAGKDPEIRYSPSGMAICHLSLATSSKRKDQNGEMIETTEWHRLVFFDKLAEIIGQYITKGSTIYVEGRLKYGKYQDKDGVEKYTTDIVVDQMQMLGGRDGGGQQGGGQQAPQQRQQAPQQAPQRQQGNGGPQYANSNGNGQQRQQPTRNAPPQNQCGFDDMDDDIPF
jgi:single-strand DNA-binding protein